MSSSTTIHFQKVGFIEEKAGTCPVCGRRATRRKEFYQTVNPWNKNTKGVVKAGWEIIEELRVQAQAWQQQPTYHAKCED